MNSSSGNPFANRYEEEDAVDAIEMAPSDTSYDQNMQSYMQHSQGSKTNLNNYQNQQQMLNQPQILSNSNSSKSLQNSSQTVFPPRQFPQQQNPTPNYPSQSPQPHSQSPMQSQYQPSGTKHNFVGSGQQQQQFNLQNSNAKDRQIVYQGQLGDQSQSILNLSDSVEHVTNLQNAQVQMNQSNPNLSHHNVQFSTYNQQLGSDRGGMNTNQLGQNPNTSVISNQSAHNNSGLAGQGGQSALVRQLSEKVRSQAERLQKLEQYKQILENRIIDIDSKHPLPVLPQHLGQKPFSIPQPELPPSSAELKRQLAIKEQDLLYAKQRNEKLVQEVETLKKQVEERSQILESQLLTQQNQSQGLSASKQGSSSDLQELLRKEVQQNEQLKKQLEVLNQGGILEKIKQLEDEKNALLDYIEENIEKSHANTNRSAAILGESGNVAAMLSGMGVQNDRLKQLEYENSKMFQLCENLKYQEATHKQRVTELEQELALRPTVQDLNDLKDQLDQIQSQYNTKCDDYSSLIKQIDPHFNENTFGGPMASQTNPMDELQQKLLGMNTLQKELDFTKEQFESTITNIKKEKEQLKQRVQDLETREQEYEERLRRAEKENDIVRARAREQFQGESERTDTLIYENDNLRKETERLQSRIKALQENCTTLQDTLNETQQELESLANEHEKLSQQLQRARTQADHLEQERDRYKQLNSDSDKELLKLRTEIVELRKETARQREDLSANNRQISSLNDQLYKLDLENRDLKHQASNLQHELSAVQNHQIDRNERQAKDWEQTIGDLTKELKYVQGELTEKEGVFQRVEQELRNKLHCLEEVTHERSQLRSRIEDLQAELSHLHNIKADKDEKLKAQIHKNEQLLQQLEQINQAYTSVKDEKEATLVVKVEKEKMIEYTQRQLQKMAKVADRSIKQLRQLAKQQLEFTQEMKFKPTQIISLPQVPHQHSSSHSQDQELEPTLLEIEQYIHHLSEVAAIINNSYKFQNKQVIDLKSENLLTIQKLQQLENKFKSISEDEMDVRDRLKYMETELEQAREKLRIKDEEKREQYHREDKIQRQNTQIKQQLEACRKEQEKLLMQIKSLLVDKERMNEEIKQRQEANESEIDRIKQLEVKLSNLYQQKEAVLILLEKIRDGMPTDSLQQLLGELFECIIEVFRQEEDYQNSEVQLLQLEGELRAFAKKEGQGANLLSTKVINLRKDVELKRQLLRDQQQQLEILKKRQESLEQQLKCTELQERRRCDVALETEKTLTEAKFEISNLKREISFVNANRKDLEVALSAAQEEKKMIERELLSLRAQLQMKINNSKQSTMMNINAPSSGQGTASLPPMHQSAALRQGDLIFANNPLSGAATVNQSANQSFYNPSRQNPLLLNDQAHQYDSLISAHNHNHNPLSPYDYNGQNPLRQQQILPQQHAINHTLHFTEQKPPHHNMELLSDRFTSAEKNQRILLTAGGLNSARGQPPQGQRTNLTSEGVENIEPNRINLAQQRLPLHSGNVSTYQKPQTLSQNRSLKNFEAPSQQFNNSNLKGNQPINIEINDELNSQNTSMHMPLSRPPLGLNPNQNQISNIDRTLLSGDTSRNTYKRPQSVRSGSIQNMARIGGGYEDSLDGGSSIQGDAEDSSQFPIRNSLKQRLNQVKNAFSAIRRNLEDQTESKIEENY